MCRETGHKYKKCPAKKAGECGRCGYPFQVLTDAKKSALNHDCEGGPDGFGDEFIDLSGDQWHAVWVAHKSQQPAPAGFVDPGAGARNKSLTVAQLAALTAREKHAAKKQARAQALEASSGDAPPAKQRKLD